MASSGPSPRGRTVSAAAARHKKRSKKSAMDLTKLAPEDSALIIDTLRNELIERDAALVAMNAELARLGNELSAKGEIVRRDHPLTPVQHLIHDRGVSKVRAGRTASLSTSEFLEALPEPEVTTTVRLAEKILEVFKTPIEHMEYLQSAEFASDIIHLADETCELLEKEPRAIFLQSPVYIFGDIHGNLEDMHFFADNIWRLGMHLTAGKFLFLGDYVDRGLSGLECVAYLMALKILAPDKIFMLRGNHETREVNGWEEHYGERSFSWQCKERFGVETGMRVWEQCNQMFDRLPLAAVIDHDIFAVHGGIPRPVRGFDNRIQAILAVPNVAGINPPTEGETQETQQVASDCIWSDPAAEDQEAEMGPDSNGFGESLRGGGAICFGMKAIDEFLDELKLSYIVRAHEAHAEGVAISKGARVFTVFSTSRDHGQGSMAMAGCVLVDFCHIQVINRSPAYKNKFVHRRGSVSIANLEQQQLEERFRLGLVIQDTVDDDDEDDEDYYYVDEHGNVHAAEPEEGEEEEGGAEDHVPGFGA